MLTLSRFMTNPYLYKNRKSPNMAHFNIIECTPGTENNSGYFINFRVKSESSKSEYISSILLETDDIITSHTKCKFKCSCASFKYEFETILHNHGGLIGNPGSTRLPKKRTGIFVCKHLIGCILILDHFNKIENIQRYIKTKGR